MRRVTTGVVLLRVTIGVVVTREACYYWGGSNT